MQTTQFVFFLFLIFAGATVLATVAVYTRQSLLAAYILLGFILGPSGFKLVADVGLAQQIGDVGIIFLLFLLGLELNPIDLLKTLRSSIPITLISCFIFAAIGIGVIYLFGYDLKESIIIGAALMFSSTIIGLKLLPAKTLHHKEVGEIMVSVLLLQDLLAIAMLIILHGNSMTGSKIVDIALTTVTLPALLGFSFFLQRYCISYLFKRFEKIKEYIFLVAIAWCLSLAELARVMGLSPEIGAFIAGISIAEGPIAIYIADNLRPLRDFCLVMFFFNTGAGIDLKNIPNIWMPVFFLTAILLFIKPLVFKWLFQRAGESPHIAKEVGMRLGQASEFSLLIAYFTSEIAPTIISDKAGDLIQATTLLTFIISSYLVVKHYPTPGNISEHQKPNK